MMPKLKLFGDNVKNNGHIPLITRWDIAKKHAS